MEYIGEIEKRLWSSADNLRANSPFASNGRIYEYFLTQFADQKAHDGGEFFTPVALVQTIVNVIEPDHGCVLDPACGSGEMFVQSAHFIERMHLDPAVLPISTNFPYPLRRYSSIIDCTLRRTLRAIMVRRV